MSISGQWVGNFWGSNNSNKGVLIINVDPYENKYKGKIIIFNQDKTSLLANIQIDPTNSNSFIGTLAGFLPLDSISKLPMSSEVFKSLKSYLPQNGSCNFELRNNKLVGSWRTNIGTSGEFDADQAPHEGNNNSEIFSWDKFKSYISQVKKEQFIYRGQPNTYKLRTSYHRTQRSDLIRYAQEDIPELKNYLCSVLDYSFNLDDEYEYAALLHLAQHHDYATPLLDWTQSPYIAAYFAFQKNSPGNEYVSIFEFNKKLWRENPDNIQIKNICCSVPSLRLIIPMPLFNKRALPQQSVSMFCNIDGIQEWIFRKEQEHSTKYLNIIRINSSERKFVLDELNFMGINAASMFPGLDGICKYLKEKNF